MSSLYQINQQITEAIDLETGEIIDEAAYEALNIEKEREARLEKQHDLERQLRKARRDVFSEDRAIAEQAEKDIKRLKDELWPYYEPQYNKTYGYMMNHLLSATD